MQTYNQDQRYSAQEIDEARQVLQRTMEGLVSSDLYPYQGEWLSAKELEKRSTTDKLESRNRFKEIIALNIVIGLLSVFLILLVALLCY